MLTVLNKQLTKSPSSSEDAFKKLEMMLDEGLASIEAGRTSPAEEVRARLNSKILEQSKKQNYAA